MFFIFETNGQKMLLTAEQVNTLTETLAGAEVLNSKYMGSNKPYLELITAPKIQDTLRFTVLDQTSYEAMVLVTKLHEDAEAAKSK
jgi:hypothetical protein